MFHAKVLKNQKAHFSICLILSKTLPIWNNVKDTAEEHKLPMKIMKIWEDACALSAAKKKTKNIYSKYLKRNAF
jgi:hypothetical protein